jgi:hypothetical protein
MCDYESPNNYGATDEEQELNDLSDLMSKLASVETQIRDDYSIEKRFGIADRIGEMWLEVSEKEKELREG